MPVKITDEMMLKSFKVFLAYLWKHLGLPPLTEVQKEIADFLQYGPKRKVIEGFRGVGKSWITSGFVLWRLKKDAQRKILVVSATKVRSDDFSTFTMRLIKEVPFLSDLIPSDDQRDSRIAFDVGPSAAAHAPSVKSAGIFGQLAGSRATDIVADDIEIPNNSATQEMREKLVKAAAEFEAILVPDPDGVVEPTITFLGTPQTEESVYNQMAAKGYTVRIWPGRYPSDPEIYSGNLAPSITEALLKNPKLVGQPTDPKRFTAMDLMEREASYGRSGFALQFMLDTTLSDALKYPLKTGDLIVMGVHPEQAPPVIQYGSGPEQLIKDLENVGFTGDRWYRPLYWQKEDWKEYEGSAMSIDPSGRGADETTYAIGKVLHGNIYVPEVGGYRDGYSEATLTALAKAAQRHKVNKIVVESNYGDGMFVSVFTPVLLKYHKCQIEEKRHNVQKEARIIDTLEPVMNQHRLIIDHEVVREDIRVAKENSAYSLFYQLTRLCRDRGALKHDDRLDALAILVAYWVEAMKRDQDIAGDDHRKTLLEKELEEFAKHVFGTNLPYSFDNDGPGSLIRPR